MKNKWLVIGLLATTLAVGGVLATGTSAFAQGPVAPGFGMGRGMMGIGGPENSLIAVAAKTLNLSVADLFAELQKGKSIADVAKAKDISTDKIVDEFLAARTQAIKSAIDSKWITQAQADAMLAYMKSHVAQTLTQVWTPNAFVPGVTAPNASGACPLCGTNQAPMFGMRRGMWR
jgi:hypothetical protein